MGTYDDFDLAFSQVSAAAKSTSQPRSMIISASLYKKVRQNSIYRKAELQC